MTTRDPSDCRITGLRVTDCLCQFCEEARIYAATIRTLEIEIDRALGDSLIRATDT